MKKVSFRPGWAASISVMLMLPILIGLGIWQLQRLAWKNNLIGELTARLQTASVDLPMLIDHPADWRFRSVRLEGVYDPTTVVSIPGRVVNGQLGSKILTLLRRKDGMAVVVDRGWVVQRDVAEYLASKKNIPDGVRSISGLARIPEAGNIFTPNNRPAEQSWYQPDPLAMGRYWGIANVAPIWVQQSVPEPETDAPVIGSLPTADLPNNHLGYAVTWFGLGLVLAVIYVVFGLKRGNDLERAQSQITNSCSLSES
jgi:surfeit locus 1 family protein